MNPTQPADHLLASFPDRSNELEEFGFKLSGGGAHISRTMMPVGLCDALRFQHSTVAAGAMATRSPKTDILMIKDVAEYLKVTERTIYRLAAAKKIPAFKVGGSWRFSRADIDRWIQQQSSAVLDAGPSSDVSHSG
jgi:excisionase family DNA binding protein